MFKLNVMDGNSGIGDSIGVAPWQQSGKALAFLLCTAIAPGAKFGAIMLSS
jgi:hypothetical protein